MTFRNRQFLEWWEYGDTSNLFPSSVLEVVASIYSASENIILKQYENISAIQSHAGMKEALSNVNKS